MDRVCGVSLPLYQFLESQSRNPNLGIPTLGSPAFTNPNLVVGEVKVDDESQSLVAIPRDIAGGWDYHMQPQTG